MAARENAYAESTGDSSTTSASAQTKVTLNWTPQAANTDYLVIWSAQISGATTLDCIVEFKDNGGTVRGAANHEDKDATDYHPVFGIWKYTSPGSPSAISFTLTYRSETAGTTVNIREARIFVIKMSADDKYAANDATDTETTTTFNSAVNLTFTPGSVGDYLIIGSCEYAFSAAGEIIHKLTHGGTDYGTAQVRPQDTSNFGSSGKIVKKNLAASSQSIDINFARSSTLAGTASCRNARIAAIRLNAFSANYYGELRNSRQTMTSTTYSDAASATGTPLAARDHLTLGSCVRDHNSTSNSAFTKLRTGGGDLIVNTLQEAVVASTTIDVPDWAQMVRRTEAVASTTWSVARATETGGTSTGINEAAIIVLDLEEAPVPIAANDNLSVSISDAVSALKFGLIRTDNPTAAITDVKNSLVGILSKLDSLLLSDSISPAPFFVSAGAGAVQGSSANTIDVPYPAGIQAGDLLVMHLSRNSSVGGKPTGFSPFVELHPTNGDAISSGGVQLFTYYTEAVGDESGSKQLGILTGTAAYIGRMYCFRSSNAAGPWTVTNGTGTASSGGTDSSIEIGNHTPSGNYSLTFVSVGLGNSTTISNSTGESGTDFTEVTSEYNGGSMTLGLQSGSQDVAALISGGVITIGTGGYGYRVFSAQKEIASGVQITALSNKTDNPTISISDVANVEASGGGPVAKSGSDSPTITVSDILTLLAKQTLTDNPSAAIADLSALLVKRTLVDNPSAAIADMSALLAKRTLTDNPTISIIDLKNALLVLLARADNPALSIADVKNTLLGLLSRTDNPTISISEVAAPVATLARADALLISVVDTVAALAAVLARTDNPSISIADTLAQLAAISQRADTLTAAISEAAANVAAVILAADNPSAAITEISNVVISAAVNAADTINIAIAEALALAAVSTRADALTITLSELALIASQLNRIDAALVAVTEANALSVTMTRTDTLAAALADTLATLRAFATRTDAPAVALTDTAQTLLSVLSRPDTLAVSVADMAAVKGLLALVDALAAILTDVATVQFGAITSLVRTVLLRASAGAGMMGAGLGEPNLTATRGTQQGAAGKDDPDLLGSRGNVDLEGQP